MMNTRLLSQAVDVARRGHARVWRPDVKPAMTLLGDDGPTDWSILVTVRPNALLVGPADAVEACLTSVTPLLIPPLCEWSAASPLPAAGAIGTLVIRNIEQLPLARQEELFAWLDRQRRRPPHIISTTAESMLPLVTAGRFLEDLYYRLNTLVLDANGRRPFQP